MSRETLSDLNINTLIGYSDKRGHAWHYRIELQGLESNHYNGPVPVDDVLRRLFNFEVIEAPIFYLLPDGRYVPSQAGRKGMLRDDNEYDLGAFKSGYQGHAYREWLLDNVAMLLDDELGIGSAGLLRKGGQAWVSVEVPESITTPEGVEFRPNLIATTSFDGSLATTYKRVFTRVVCDNTAEMALQEDGQEFKARHSKYSAYKIVDARNALQIVHTMTDDYAQEITRLCDWKVSEAEFNALLTQLIPINDEISKKSLTMREGKRAEITQMYHNDPRCAPWKGTAYGVSQAFSTWFHHSSIVRGTTRGVRNMENAINGETGKHDKMVLDALATITV